MLRRPKADRHDSFERTVPIRESVDWPMTKEFAFGSSIIDEGMAVKVKRVYAKPVKADGLRILVDHLWPRGLSRDAAMVDEWLRDLAPSDELRHWFHAYPAAWATFRKRYMKELARPEANAALETLLVNNAPASVLPGCNNTAATSTKHETKKTVYKTYSNLLTYL